MFYPRGAIESALERSTAPKVTVEGLDDVGSALEHARVEIDESNRRDPKVVEQVARWTERALVRHVEQAARDTIVAAVERERERTRAEAPIGWARVLTGLESCGFCAILASRGPIYVTEESAGRVVGQVRSAMAQFNQVPARTRGSRDRGERYHDGCDCIVVQVFDSADWIGMEAWDELEQLWIESDGRKDFEKRFRQIREDGDVEKYVGAVDPGATEPSATEPRENPTNRERRQGAPGGPGGSRPPRVPPRGGKGYSDDDEERRLECELDDAMRRRT